MDLNKEIKTTFAAWLAIKKVGNKAIGMPEHAITLMCVAGISAFLLAATSALAEILAPLIVLAILPRLFLWLGPKYVPSLFADEEETK